MSLEPKDLEAALPPSYSMATPTNTTRQTEQSLQQRANALNLREEHLSLRETRISNKEAIDAHLQIAVEAHLHWSLFLAILLWLAAWILACCYIGTHLHTKLSSDDLGLIARIVSIAGVVEVYRVGGRLQLDGWLLETAPGSWSRGLFIGLRYQSEFLLLVLASAMALVMVPGRQTRE
ncbi:hypothetical protein LTR29_003745 [Friedmanniomyces endolithicus]|nr:hypothetical protein LTR29_003745 [Friedmanniomyces endolithicus]